jgi:hypothetical protein
VPPGPVGVPLGPAPIKGGPAAILLIFDVVTFMNQMNALSSQVAYMNFMNRWVEIGKHVGRSNGISGCGCLVFDAIILRRETDISTSIPIKLQDAFFTFYDLPCKEVVHNKEYVYGDQIRGHLTRYFIQHKAFKQDVCF